MTGPILILHAIKYKLIFHHNLLHYYSHTVYAAEMFTLLHTKSCNVCFYAIYENYELSKLYTSTNHLSLLPQLGSSSLGL